MKCSQKHRGIVAKTEDASMINWLNDLKENEPEEYVKVLQAAEPGPGQKYSKFNLTMYKETQYAKKIRGVRENQEAMTWSRYLKYHTEEICPEDRMQPAECRASWIKDMSTEDFEKHDIFSKKTGNFEKRDIVWVTTGKQRYKKKEEEESRSVQRIHSSQTGSDSAAASARQRMQNFVTLSGDRGFDGPPLLHCFINLRQAPHRPPTWMF